MKNSSIQYALPCGVALFVFMKIIGLQFCSFGTKHEVHPRFLDDRQLDVWLDVCVMVL